MAPERAQRAQARLVEPRSARPRLEGRGDRTAERLCPGAELVALGRREREGLGGEALAREDGRLKARERLGGRPLGVEGSRVSRSAISTWRSAMASSRSRRSDDRAPAGPRVPWVEEHLRAPAPSDASEVALRAMLARARAEAAKQDPTVGRVYGVLDRGPG